MSAEIKLLQLPETYEKIAELLGNKETPNAILSRFIMPIQEAERELAEIIAETYGDGKVVFILGKPGAGKSTFIHSLAWRPTTKIRKIESLNCSKTDSTSLLSTILSFIRKLSEDAVENKEKGHTAVVLDYIETLLEQDHTQVKAFFRNLNGILRGAPILILWPVTDLNDTKLMMEYASSVSSTLFVKDREILNFRGPPTSSFPNIAKNTISVLNNGLSISDFNLTDEDFEEVLNLINNSNKSDITIRNYLLEVRKRWAEVSGHLKSTREKIPLQTEIWFVVAYPDAENISGQFSRKSKDVFDAWIASHAKLSEYIHNNQKEAAWDAKEGLK